MSTNAESLRCQLTLEVSLKMRLEEVVVIVNAVPFLGKSVASAGAARAGKKGACSVDVYGDG